MRGSIDFGYTGDAPPIFSQAAGGNLVYVAASAPSGDGEAILVKADSPIRSVADLKGRKVAVGRGTSAHNLLIAAPGEGGPRVLGHHARLPDARRCRLGLRQ